MQAAVALLIIGFFLSLQMFNLEGFFGCLLFHRLTAEKNSVGFSPPPPASLLIRHEILVPALPIYLGNGPTCPDFFFGGGQKNQ